MPYDIQVTWTRASGTGQPIDRWFASVKRPTHTESFAKVERIDGQWWLIVYPKFLLRHRPGLREHRIRYRYARTAKKHLEAWARANWPTIERRWGIYTPPPGK